MDLAVLKQTALNLREKLELYIEEDEDIAALADELNPLIEQAVAGELIEEIDFEDVPGAYQLEEGFLAEFDGLEEAYLDFQMAVSGESAYEDDEEEDENA